MMRGNLIVAATLLVSLLNSSIPAFAAGADGFCVGLKSVAAQTGTGFAKFRGAQISVRHGTSGLTYTDYTYAATRALPGAIQSSCEIITTIDVGKRSGSYRCFFEYGGPKRLSKLQTLGAAIAHCIGPTTDDNIDIYPDEDVGSIDFVRSSFQVSIDASDSQPLVLLISKPSHL